MAGKTRATLPLFAALLIALGVALLTSHFLRTAPPPSPDRALSLLGTPPDWEMLKRYDGTMSRRDFEQLLRTVYTIGNRWEDFITLDDAAATIRTSFRDPSQSVVVSFATADAAPPPPRPWRPAATLPPAPAGRPLAGLKIAIDPGHIGGQFAKIEERWFQIRGQAPVMEGEMALRAARHLKPLLEALGATVDLVRKDNRPVSTASAEDFAAYAAARLPAGTPTEQRALATRLFYRNAEIQARATLINRIIKPDLVLCLHFNAEHWGGNPSDPQLSERNHFHLILNGAYTTGEVAHDDERFTMISRLLQRTHAEELALAKTLARVFATETDLPPFSYKPNSPRALPLDDSHYLWARNLLANRIYGCPVIFFEPYVMNSAEVHARIQAGDYEGTKTVAGKERPSIYREYAAAAAKGLELYYQSSRPIQ